MADLSNEKTAIMQFLQDHVMDKKLRTETTTYQLEAGKLEGEFSSQATFNYFTITQDGFAFDLSMVNKESVYKLENDEKQLVPERSHENVNVFRYELAERKSTGMMTGLLQIKASTVPDQEAIAWGVHQVQLKEKELSWKEMQLLYRDMTYTTGKYRPVAQHARSRLFLVDGKLHFEYVIQLFEVTDLQTLEKKSSQDTLPEFLFKEVTDN